MNSESWGIESIIYEFIGIIYEVLNENVYLEYSPALDVPVLSIATMVDVKLPIA